MIDAATTAYAARLAVLSLAFGLAAGLAVEASWRLFDLTSPDRSAPDRLRLATAHFLALLMSPPIVAVSAFLAHHSLGPVVTRTPAAQPLMHLPQASPATCLILIVWFVGLVAMLSFVVVQYLQQGRVNRRFACRLLREDAARMAKRFGDRRFSVAVGDVSVPQVMGVFTPRLTVPTSLARLPVAEREAVLLHEFAHIVRRDFLVNLAQRIALALVWCQPVAWVMYRRICAEREVCCDQVAVAKGASRAALGRALLKLSASHTSSGLAMAAVGHGTLTWRLNQLMPREAAPASRRSPAIALSSFALVASLVGGVLLTTVDEQLTDLYMASALGPVVAITARDPAGTFRLQVRQGRVIGASVDAGPLPEAAIRQRAEKVVLLDVEQQPIVSLNVTKAGRIEWEARAATS